MGNTIQTLPLNLQQLALARQIQQPQTPQYPAALNQNLGNVQIPQIKPYSNPYSGLAVQAYQNYLNQLKNTPQQSNYKPSRLRNILADASGIFRGITSLNPVAGENQARVIKEYPYRVAWQRYMQNLYPAQQGASAAGQLAAINNNMAAQYYNALKVGAMYQNAESNRMKALANQYNAQLNASKIPILQQEADAASRRVANEPTAEERKTELAAKLQQENENSIRRVNALIKENNDRIAAEAKQGELNRDQREAAYKANVIQHMWQDQVPDKDKGTVITMAAANYPKLFTFKKDKNGNKYPVPKDNMSPKEKANFRDAIENAIRVYSVKHNLPYAAQMDQYESNDNPMITGFKPNASQ